MAEASGATNILDRMILAQERLAIAAWQQI